MVGNKVIAVDLGGTFLRIALVKGNKILKYTKKSTPKTKSLLLKELVSSISELINKGVKGIKEIKGIGIACPGPLEKGIVKNPPNLALQNFNLEKFIKNKFHKKTIIENDANCVALAELKLGCKKNNFIIITLGTGIGGGIVINKQLYKGQAYAGEFGHIINNKKYLEKIWQARVKESYIIQSIGSLINIFDPEVIILAGGLEQSKIAFVNKVKRQVGKYVYIPRKPNIWWTKLKHPGILGASLLIK